MISQLQENSKTLITSRRMRASFALVILAVVFAANIDNTVAQRVYGVASRTTVATNGHTTVVHKTTAVVTGPVLPHGYFAVLPVGYRAIGGGIFVVGSVRYRASFYQGRTVYIRL